MSTATDQQSDKKTAEVNTGSSIRRRDVSVSDELENSSLHPLLKKIYANRGVTTLKQIDYSLKELLDFSLLKDIDIAADIVSQAIIEAKRIVIVGDFDADGATSCAV
ncbi:MAG: hypothetical protein KAT61_01590, partial [Gammaproteobacteria bacterium]|nr:hypothetical protein [Gammaproteobacteria bacterium]